MTCKKILKTVNIVLLIYFVLADKSVEEQFKEFKSLYNKLYYGAKHENNAFNNFANNLKKVDYLNAKYGNKTTIFRLNKYADLNPEEINQMYGITIQPYFKDFNDATARTKDDADNLPTLEDMHLYNLNNVKDLYYKWMKKTGKQNYTKKYDREMHYYRFIKTVVEINRQKAEGKKVDLDGNADTIQHPDEYFYG